MSQMTTFQRFLPILMCRTIRFIIYPGFQLLDVAGPVAAFESANEIVGSSYKIELASLDGGSVNSSSGLALATKRLTNCPLLNEMGDTLVTVGGHGINEASHNAELLRLLKYQALPVSRMASICSGTFLYAAAGLLHGKTVTTHWKRSNDFQRRFPEVQLESDKIYINDGNFWSSAGITAGIDLALALIATDLGEQVARQSARQLVVYYRRPGGQSQYSALLELSNPQGRFADLLDFVRCNLHKSLSVEDLAAYVCMSARHFARVFVVETGSTPAKAVERLRIEAAISALENGVPMQRVVKQCGFGSTETLRRACLRLRGMPPSALRRS